MCGFGGIVSTDFSSVEDSKKVLNNVKIFTLAESLGGVESLICHLSSMTHASVPKEEIEKYGFTDAFIEFQSKLRMLKI